MRVTPYLYCWYQCGNGECIAKKLFCDEHPDCTDGSDESACSVEEVRWPKGVKRLKLESKIHGGKCGKPRCHLFRAVQKTILNVVVYFCRIPIDPLPVTCPSASCRTASAHQMGPGMRSLSSKTHKNLYEGWNVTFPIAIRVDRQAWLGKQKTIKSAEPLIAWYPFKEYIII